MRFLRRILCFCGLCKFEYRFSKVVGTKPMFKPCMGIKEQEEYLEFCIHCNQPECWGWPEYKLGRWVSGGPESEL